MFEQPIWINQWITLQDRDRINSLVRDFMPSSDIKWSSDYYGKHRSARNPEENIFIGKYGEFVACQWLRSLNMQTSLPDLRTRFRHNKGWGCDLVCEGEPVHVKTCPSRTSMSWTFQYSNDDRPGGKDPLFEKGFNDAVMLVHASKENRKSLVVAIVPWSSLVTILKEPRLSRYKGLKKCAYIDDVRKLCLETGGTFKWKRPDDETPQVPDSGTEPEVWDDGDTDDFGDAASVQP